jgi:hypothetical protein
MKRPVIVKSQGVFLNTLAETVHSGLELVVRAFKIFGFRRLFLYFYVQKEKVFYYGTKIVSITGKSLTQ